MERYESLGLVGEGSYGTVLKCRHRDSGRLVAIKKFMDSDDDKTVKKIALREIKLLRQLRHDNLVNLLEVWRRRRRWYLVFEFVERTLLDDLEQNPSGLDLNTSRQYLFQILRAAAFCHQHNIIHRDVKPENILISQGGVVKLCDFGFARTMTSPAEGGVYTDYVATRWYRAPELLVGDTQYGKPVDVWAVGCLLLEMLTGQPLFPGDSDLDQIYHIVRCFGNLTAHHQELFYRNPVFSGVRLPECSGVPLEDRFPTVTPTALDLAQSCLRMDPERRAHCSELQEHPLFTQDSFHIRILDELNAKIQKDHRENSTFPKITKTPRQEKDEGDEKNRRSKDKKQSEDSHERVDKEKRNQEGGEEERTLKSKGKQPSKPSKTIRNPSEPSTSTKPSKTSGAKIVDNAAKMTAAMKTKLGKVIGGELRKEPELYKSVVAKCKQGNVAPPEPSEVRLKTKNTKDSGSSGLHSSCSNNIEKNMMEVWRSAKSEPSQDFGKSWNNSNMKVPKLSKTAITGRPNGSSSPKVSFRSAIDRTDTTENPEGASTAIIPSKSSNNHREVATPTIPSITKPCKTTTTAEHQADRSTMDTEPRRTSECLKVLPSNPKTTSNMTQNNAPLSSRPLKTLSSSTVSIEAIPAHSTTTLPNRNLQTGLYSDTKPTNDATCELKSLRGLPTDRDPTEGSTATRTQQDGCNSSHKDIKDDPSWLKMSPAAITAANASEIDYKKNPEYCGTGSIHQQSTSKSKTSSGSRTTSTFMKVSDKENREHLAPPVSFGATTKSLVSQTSNIEKINSSSEAETHMKPLRPPHSKPLIGEPETQLGSFSNYKYTTTIKTEKTPVSTQTRKRREHPDRTNSVNISTISDPTSFTWTGHKRSVVHNKDTLDVNELDLTVPRSSPPPPPPPPSSTPLLLPPSSTPLIPSFSVISTNSPAASDHLHLGAGFHPGSHSLRCTDRPKHHGGHLTGPLSAQVSEKKLTCERSLPSGMKATKKPDVHFPGLRSSTLPELRGREGKHNKSTSRDQRKDKQPVLFSPAPDPQQH